MTNKIWMADGPQLHHLHCPVCRHLLDGVTEISTAPTKKAAPQSGDVTVCCYCASLLVFVQSFASYRHVSLRAATPAEEVEMRRDPLHDLIWKTVQDIRDNKKFNRRRG